MSQGTEQHLEHAEHAQHAAHDPFDRRVAMTMAIVAAALACITMLSHRSHNDTLRFQNDALRLQADTNRLQTRANILHTRASDQWSYFQAKKNRQYLYETAAELLAVTAKDPGDPEAPAKAKKYTTGWKDKSAKYETDTKKIEEEARGLVAEAKALQDEAQAKFEGGEKGHGESEAGRQDEQGYEQLLHESHQVHLRSNRYDLAELAVELALVLCSICILTKNRSFWLTGIGFGVLGMAVALSGLFMP